MIEILEKAIAAFGALAIAGGAVTGFAWWLFKMFSEKWLSNTFAQRLAAFRHDQQKEIEQLRFEISKLFDRTTKLHQQEFEVLPHAWSLLVTSYSAARGLTASLQRYPDIQGMSEPQLDEFIRNNSDLKDWQKEELRKASDQNRYFQQAIFWPRLNNARKKCRKSALFLRRKGIFMPPSLKEKFETIENLVWDALNECELNKNDAVWPKHQADQDKLNTQGEALMTKLEKEIQERLWN
jgi:hypothetical protein